MPVQSHPTYRAMRGTSLALTLLIFAAGTALAQGSAAFARLAGQWTGSGSIELANGTREPIKCRATYDVLEERSNLQLNIRCASESYNFDLRGSATYSAGAITGVWSESTRNIAGTLSGRAEDGRFQVLAESPSFAATLTLLTHGNRQTVAIKSQDPQSSVKGASISLRRS
jgi:hypothetical protein